MGLKKAVCKRRRKNGRKIKDAIEGSEEALCLRHVRTRLLRDVVFLDVLVMLVFVHLVEEMWSPGCRAPWLDTRGVHFINLVMIKR